jgi:hypothetical protein
MEIIMALANPFIGQHVLIRTRSAGVHIGILDQYETGSALLKNSRRIWYWEGAFTLSAVASVGIQPASSKLSVRIPAMLVEEVIEVIPTSEKAQATFDASPERIERA